MGRPKSSGNAQHRGERNAQKHAGRSAAPNSIVLLVERNGNSVELRGTEPRPPRPDRTLPVCGAYVVLRHGTPEFRFVQLDPLDDTHVLRFANVRFPARLFQQRFDSNEQFRLDLTEYVKTAAPKHQHGYFAELAASALSHAQVAPTLVVDAEIELMYRSGDQASVVFLTTSAGERNAAILGHSKTLTLRADIEFTLSTRALSDLYWSWDRVLRSEKDLHSEQVVG